MSSPPAARPSRGLYLAVFLQGAALLSLEIVLSRVLAVAMWHHFASLVISLALLGMTLGAMTVYLRPPSAAGTDRLLFRCLVSFGLAAAAIFGFFWVLAAFPSLGYRFFGVFHHPYFEPFRTATFPSEGALLISLACLLVLMALPFFAGGMYITAVLSRHGLLTGSLYAADLAGAGAGCFLAVAVLNRVDGITAILLSAVPALLAAILAAGSRRRRLLGAGCLALLAVLAAANLARPFARFVFVRGRYQPEIRYEKWSATSRVVVYPYSGGQEEGSWGQSRLTADEIPPQMGLVVDDTGYTAMLRFPGDGRLDFMRHNLISLPYVLRPSSETLIIGPGGGRDILAAEAMGAARITAVEINPLVVEAVDGVFGEFTGRLYSRPGVTTHVTDARHFLRRSSETYDVIQASLVYGRLPSSAGAFTLTEEPLYTKESFREYLGHLRPDGLLSITRFVYERRILRLVSLALDALRSTGAAEPRRHVFIAAERGLATVLVKTAPFTDGELEQLSGWCRELGFQVLYSPDTPGAGGFHRLLDAADARAFYRDFRFDVTPPTDDRPYFYYLLKAGDFWKTLLASGDYDYEDRAVIVVRNALLLLAGFTLLLALVPLAGRRRLRRPAALAPPLIYFGGIAAGFIVAENLLLKLLILYLGYPVLSLTVVLAALLMSAGAGSLAVQKWFPSGESRPLRLWLAATVLVLAVFPYGLEALVTGTLAAGLVLRIILSAAIIAPLGFLLGGALPGGLGILGRRHRDLVPWAFGINGAFSVIGAMVTMLLALNYGYRATWLLAPCGYLAALLALGALEGRDHAS